MDRWRTRDAGINPTSTRHASPATATKDPESTADSVRGVAGAFFCPSSRFTAFRRDSASPIDESEPLREGDLN